MKPRLAVIYEDRDILVIDKPPGLLTSTVPREKRPTALSMVREYVRSREPRARVGLIHRLDRDASGLLIFSKNSAAYASLKRQFFRHSVERTYAAIVHGAPNPRRGRIESRLIELPDGRMVRTRISAKGQLAVTEYQTVASRADFSLLRIRLHTGRKHQIRSQLAHRGHPVLNDPIYAEQNTGRRLMLVAVELAIDHPRTGKRMKFTVQPPSQMKAMLE